MWALTQRPFDSRTCELLLRKQNCPMRKHRSDACGRPSTGLVVFSGRVFSGNWKCKQCGAAKPLRDSGSILEFLNSREEAVNKRARR